MVNILSYADTVYTYTGSSLTYTIRRNNVSRDVVFRGTARKSPKEYGISINVGKIIRSYLKSELSDFRDIYNYTVQYQNNAYIEFILTGDIATYDSETGNWIITETQLETYKVLLGEDYGDTWDGGHKMMSKQINNHADSRMLGFLTVFNPVTSQTQTQIGYREFNIELSGSTVFEWTSGISILTAVSCTNWSVVSAATSYSWITVNKFSDKIAITVTENTGVTREGAFYLFYPGPDFRPVYLTYVITQNQLEWEFELESTSVDLPYSGGSATVGLTTNGPAEYINIDTPYWITATTDASNVYITVGVNTGSTHRTDFITFTTNVPSAQTLGRLEVDQEYYYFELVDPSQTEINVNYPSGSVTIPVRTNAQTVSVISNQPWISGSYDNGVITLTYLENEEDDARSATISIVTDIRNEATIEFLQKEDDVYVDKYFTIEAKENGVIRTYKGGNNVSHYYKVRKNNGNWIDTDNGGTGVTVSSGDVLEYKFNTSYKSHPASGSGIVFSATCEFNVYGNIMSLVYGDNFSSKTDLTEYNVYFSDLFKGNRKLKSARKLVLPATLLPSGGNVNYSVYSNMFADCTSLVSGPSLLPSLSLSESCYSNMFARCSSLTSVPTLPATSLKEACYSEMFRGCTSLVNAPTLPALSLASECYQYMFAGCTSLATAPSLPAETLAEYCYLQMFSGCTSLVTAPVLPSTTLAPGCYQYMFKNCTSLTTAPDLPATTLSTAATSYCYSGMFSGCTQLNYIKCLITSMSGGSATNFRRNWVDGVASTGTFVKKAGINWSTGVNGIPSGWTVQEV